MLEIETQAAGRAVLTPLSDNSPVRGGSQSVTVTASGIEVIAPASSYFGIAEHRVVMAMIAC